ncbi:MAG TPA: LysR family transcriptional regulator [Rhodospirillales bacterium]|nr:LysR family transcriptional regulator [Rhodospirillales bacterium]
MSYPIDHRPIRQFIAAVEHGNITSASLALNISQPALTKSIRKLESSLGVKLLERHSRGVVPTSYGEILLRRGKLVELEFEYAAAEIEAMKGGNKGAIRIGASPVFATLFIPKVSAKIIQSNIGLKVDLINGVLDTLVPNLLQGDLDIICSALDFPDHPEIVKEHLIDFKHTVFARTNHPLAKQKNITAIDLMAYEWVMLAQDHIAISRLGSYFSSNGISPPTIAMETNSFETAFSMVKEGNFLTSATSSMANAAQISGLTPLLIQGTLWNFPAGVSYRRSTSTPKIVKEFINSLRNEIASVLTN